jgi:hypothetical protein
MKRETARIATLRESAYADFHRMMADLEDMTTAEYS